MSAVTVGDKSFYWQTERGAETQRAETTRNANIFHEWLKGASIRDLKFRYGLSDGYIRQLIHDMRQK